MSPLVVIISILFIILYLFFGSITYGFLKDKDWNNYDSPPKSIPAVMWPIYWLCYAAWRIFHTGESIGKKFGRNEDE
jgi:hypothetical protein